MRTLLVLTLIATAAPWAAAQPLDRAPGGLVDTLGAIQHLAVAGRASATPSVATRGNVVVVAWSAASREATDLYLARSTDGGRSFTSPVRVNDRPDDVDVGGEMPPRVVFVPRPNAPNLADVAVSWRSSADGADAIRLAWSRDGGASFEPAATIHDAGLPGIRGWQAIAGTEAGTLHALWLDGREADGPTREPRHGPRQDLMHAVIHPDGQRTETRLAADVCFCCKTAVVVNGDTVHAAWRHIFAGSERDIATSTARSGKAFGRPLRVSEDGWVLHGCPDDGPTLAADAAGILHLAWPTLVDSPEPHVEIFHAQAAPSADFGPRQPLPLLGGTDASHPQISGDGDGGVMVAWDEIQDSVRRVVVSRLRARSDAAASFEPPVVVSEETSGSYPAVGEVEGAVVVAWTSSPGDASRIAVRRIATGMSRNE